MLLSCIVEPSSRMGDENQYQKWYGLRCLIWIHYICNNCTSPLSAHVYWNLRSLPPFNINNTHSHTHTQLFPTKLATSQGWLGLNVYSHCSFHNSPFLKTSTASYRYPTFKNNTILRSVLQMGVYNYSSLTSISGIVDDSSNFRIKRIQQ